MILARVSLLLTLVLTASCAHLAGSPPAPPLAVPAADAPKEFSWFPFKWKTGVVLTYNVHSAMETSTGATDQSRTTMQLRGLDKTARGAVRVQLLVDNTEYGVVLMEESGLLQDIIPAKPEYTPAFTALAEWLQNPLVKQALMKPQTAGETVSVEFPTAKFRRAFPLDWGQYLAATMTIRCQFTGYVHLGGALAVAYRSEVPNMLSAPIRGRDRSNQEFRIDSIGGEGVEYFDPEEGYSISRYEIMTASGTHAGKPFAFRTVTLTSLDAEGSRGLRRRGF